MKEWIEQTLEREISIINHQTHYKFWTISLYWSGICREFTANVNESSGKIKKLSLLCQKISSTQIQKCKGRKGQWSVRIIFMCPDIYVYYLLDRVYLILTVKKKNVWIKWKEWVERDFMENLEQIFYLFFIPDKKKLER